MRLRSQAFGGVLAALLPACPLPARAEPSVSAAWFDRALRSDAEGDARLAFSLYRRAADVGLPAAEFNVAVMLDSGRGVPSDPAQAATWYARAASHGDARAAYNLAQLYEAGEGVPKNKDIARAWLAAASLPAAREKLAAARFTSKEGSAVSLIAPSPVAPASGAKSDPRIGGVELVWTSPSQSEPVQYFAELRALDADGSHEVFSGFTERSSVFAKLVSVGGSYAWRVTSVAQKKSKYLASGWTRFSVAPASEAR